MSPVAFRTWVCGLWWLLALSAVIIAMFRLDATLRVGQSNVTTICEEISISNLHTIQHGGRVYSDCFTYPYQTSLFNWLFYDTYGGLAALVQPAAQYLPTVLRLLTMAFVVVGLLTSMAGLRRFTVLLGVRPDAWLLIPLSVVTWFGPIIGWWFVTVRPDLPAVVFAYLGFTIAVITDPDRAPVRLALAGVCFFLAWSFKQTTVGMLGGTVLGLLVLREWKPAALLSMVFGALVAGWLLIAGSAYWTNTFSAPTLSEWSPDNVYTIALLWLIFTGPYLIAGAAAAFYGLSAEQRKALFHSRPFLRTAVAFLACMAWHALCSGRLGASENYYFESAVLGVTLTAQVYLYAVGVGVGIPATGEKRVKFIGLTVLVLLWGAGFTAAVFVPFHKPYTKTGEELPFSASLPRPAYPETLLQQVREGPRPIFCDDPLLALQAMGPGAVANPVLEYTIYLRAEKRGRIRDDGLEGRIRHGMFAALWLKTPEDAYRNWEDVAREAGYRPQPPIGSMQEWVRPAYQPGQ
jgi:hypothetical protein